MKKNDTGKTELRQNTNVQSYKSIDVNSRNKNENHN